MELSSKFKTVIDLDGVLIVEFNALTGKTIDSITKITNNKENNFFITESPSVLLYYVFYMFCLPKLNHRNLLLCRNDIFYKSFN